MRRAWIGSKALAAVLFLAASCAPAPPAVVVTGGAPPAAPGADRGTVLVVRPVIALAGADAAWRARLLRDAAPEPVGAVLPAPPLAEVIVRVDAGGLVSVVQPAADGLGPGQRVAIGRPTGSDGAVALSRL